MADQIYYSVFTKKGLELLTESIQNGTKLGITSMAFGDGGGSLPVPNEAFTQLVNEVHRTQLNSLAPDPNNANWLRAEAIIASSVGGFNIRELGLYAGDVLVAYSNYPATYKPNPADGTARIMTFRMILQIDNVANFELVIDPDVVLATIQSVSEAKTEVYQNTVSQIESIEDLISLQTWLNRIVYSKAYTKNGNTLGSGFFKCVLSNAAVDNIFTFASSDASYRFIRQLDTVKINLYQCGLLCDGSDESDKFISILAILKSIAQTNKVVIELDGENAQVIVNKPFTIDLSWINLTYMSIYAPEFLPTTPTALMTCTNSYSASAGERNKNYGTQNLFKEVYIYGNPLARSPANGYKSIGVYFNTGSNATFSGGVADTLTIAYFSDALCFTSNFYLFTFFNCSFDRNYNIVTDSKRRGLTTTIDNAGENIRFDKCVFSNGSKIWDTNHQWFVNFKNCSLDYTGGSQSTNITQFDLYNSEVLCFTDCHFESGNINNNWTDKFFNCYSTSAITIQGGSIIASNEYNSVPFFFFDNSTAASFSLQDTFIWGLAITGVWANRGLIKFQPKVNNVVSLVAQRLLTISTNMLDYNFSKYTNIVDSWFANGTRTSVLISDQVSLALSSLSDNVTPALKVTKLASGTASFSLDVPISKSGYRPSALFNIISGIISASKSITITASLCKSSNVFDSYGVVSTKANKQIWTTTVSLSQIANTAIAASVASAVQFQNEFSNYDFVRYTFSITNLTQNDYFFIQSAVVDKCF